MIIWYIVELLVNFVQVYVIFKFFELYYERRLKFRYSVETAVLVMTAVLCLLNYTVSNKPFIYLIYILIFYTLTIFLFKGNIFSKCITVFLIMALLGVCELLVAVLISLISGVDLKSSQQQGFVRLEGMIISQTIFIYVYMIMKGNIKKEKIYLIDRRYYFLTGTILFLTVIVIFMTIWMYGNIGNENIDNNLFAFTLCVSLISIIAIVLTDRIIKDMNEKHKDEMELQRMKMEHAYLSDVNSALEELRILKHDMRGELAIIHGYNELGQKDKIRSHIEKKLQEMNVQLMPKIDKDNVITSFLNFKLKEARSEKIEVNIKSSLTEENEIDIDKEDICRVLNNIINNAIEACKQCDKKYINLYINILNNCIVIKSENPFSGEIKKEDGKILTIKKDKAKHGYGLKSIKNIAEKYGGFMNVNYINNVFTIEVQMLIKI